MTTHLLSLSEIGTFAGSVSAVVAMTNGLRYAFDLNPKVVGLVGSVLVSFSWALVAGPMSAELLLVAFLNSFMIYCGSIGMAGIAAAASSSKKQPRKKNSTFGETEEVNEGNKDFFDYWY